MRAEHTRLKQMQFSGNALGFLEDKYADLVRQYSLETWKCPTRRFGRTEIQMPILTLGGMRQQKTWAPGENFTLADVGKDCEDNFEKIIDRALQLGINHFETARGYGSSELQFGPVIKKHKRESFILQTKVCPSPDAATFRKSLETSFEKLQLEGDDEYIDLFAFHGINYPAQLDWVLKDGGCMEVVEEYRAKGKIRHVGFSTHGMEPTITAAIETGKFDYVNLHHHFIGSYTASGTGPVGGNRSAVEAAKRHDMGVFIISATDKGGKLYRPSVRFAELTKPMTPIAFNDSYLWGLEAADGTPLIHTLVVGAARPTDLDDHIAAAVIYKENTDQVRKHVAEAESRLYKAVDDMFGVDFRSTYYKNLPDAWENTEGITVGYFLWLRWIAMAWGLFEYAKERYQNLSGNLKDWDEEKTFEENVKKVFNFCPGLPLRQERYNNLRACLLEYTNNDTTRTEQVMRMLEEARAMFSGDGCLVTGDGIPNIPGFKEYCRCVYDLQPDVPFPERK